MLSGDPTETKCNDLVTRQTFLPSGSVTGGLSRWAIFTALLDQPTCCYSKNDEAVPLCPLTNVT